MCVCVCVCDLHVTLRAKALSNAVRWFRVSRVDSNERLLLYKL